VVREVTKIISARKPPPTVECSSNRRLVWVAAVAQVQAKEAGGVEATKSDLAPLVPHRCACISVYVIYVLFSLFFVFVFVLW
jgi:hypothetical protein